MTCGKCVGLALASIGWAAFIVGLALEHMGERSGALIVTLAQWVIVTGLGVAIVGATETGFGALDRFFSEIAARTRGKSGAHPGAADAPVESPPALAAPQPQARAALRADPPAKPQPRLAQPRPQPALDPLDDFERVYAAGRPGEGLAPEPYPEAAYRQEAYRQDAYRQGSYRPDAYRQEGHRQEVHRNEARESRPAPGPAFDEADVYAAARPPRPDARYERPAPASPPRPRAHAPAEARPRAPAPPVVPPRENLFPEFAAPDYAPRPRERLDAPPAYHPAPAPAANAPEAPRERPRPACVERGEIAARPYRKFADGSVEIDTLLGSRRFASMEDACAFVGARAPTPFEPDADVA